MTCGVCIGTDSYEYLVEFCHESQPVARKVHQCCECGSAIPIGTRYFKVIGKWEGVFETIRQCLPCHEIQEVFSCGKNWLYGGLWEMWDDANGFADLTVHDPCFQKLTDETRRFLVAKWWEWKEEHSDE